MKSKAAVAFKAGEPLQIVEIDVAPPQKGEVLVQITHTGVCHTDAFTLSGEDPEGGNSAITGMPSFTQSAATGSSKSRLRRSTPGMELTASLRCIPSCTNTG